MMFLLYINDIGDHYIIPRSEYLPITACCIKIYQTKTMLTDYKTTWTNYKNGLTFGKLNVMQILYLLSMHSKRDPTLRGFAKLKKFQNCKKNGSGWVGPGLIRIKTKLENPPTWLCTWRHKSNVRVLEL